MFKRIITGLIVVIALVAVAPAAANAAVFKTEEQAESYLWNNYADWYTEDGYEMDDATCDGYGRYRDGGDGYDDRYTKFECESDYYDSEWDEGFTDVDVLKARSWGFKIRNIDSYDW